MRLPLSAYADKGYDACIHQKLFEIFCKLIAAYLAKSAQFRLVSQDKDQKYYSRFKIFAVSPEICRCAVRSLSRDLSGMSAHTCNL